MNLFAEADEFVRVVLKQGMGPGGGCVAEAVFGQGPSNFFQRAPQGSSQFFGFCPSTDQKDPLLNVCGNSRFGFLTPILLLVEVDQKQHSPFRVNSKFLDMNFFKFIQYVTPTACLRKYMDESAVYGIVQNEAVKHLRICVIFRENQKVVDVLADAHGSTSPRISAFTRSPFISKSSRRLTIVGSK